MATLAMLLLVGLVAVGVIAGVIVLIVRLTDSSKAEPFVPHAWQPMNPPGWYPDQNDPNLMRYFDGQHWTSATQRRF